ncbi:hypothetical protein [Cryobacterium zhongshanensis]|uniref:Uncharacterized protein n=1 Tax=Cryobacterium zhongshanensis TaxID=2928153 RepID=A0AA41QX02_9MICO|nr:hypothetical protein [Cryobacterium zhongshanensis]MCI4659695.1 hypothetical protein [Cryobacterium zhongshanensis]
MTRLTADETLRHIHYKASSHELREDLAERMLELFNEDPSLDYAALRTAALKREMPDVVYHASALRNQPSIACFGLLASDPRRGHAGVYALGQPRGVYASAKPDEIGFWSGSATSWGVWSITGALSLPHRQDPLNPEHFVIECDVPNHMIEFRGSREIRHLFR